MDIYQFDDRNLHWQQLNGFEHLLYSILHIDEKNLIADVLFKFSAKQKIVLHRHKALNHTFVIQGEHRLYQANGDIKEIRPVGSYKVSVASDEPHSEGGGDHDAVVLFSIRGTAGVLYEILDDKLNPIGTISMQDLIGLSKTQGASG